MICYKDITFCSYWKDCKNSRECGRALTYKIREGAIKLGLPIAQFADKPTCHEQTETRETVQKAVPKRDN